LFINNEIKKAPLKGAPYITKHLRNSANNSSTYDLEYGYNSSPLFVTINHWSKTILFLYIISNSLDFFFL
ncbi:hypothetical protein, partial [Bacillus cereus]